MYIKRDIEGLLTAAAESFQVMTIFGSRQVGKTTTVQRLFGENFNIITTDDNDNFMLLRYFRFS